MTFTFCLVSLPTLFSRLLNKAPTQDVASPIVREEGSRACKPVTEGLIDYVPGSQRPATQCEDMALWPEFLV